VVLPPSPSVRQSHNGTRHVAIRLAFASFVKQSADAGSLAARCIQEAGATPADDASDRAHVLGFLAFLARADVKLDALTFCELFARYSSARRSRLHRTSNRVVRATDPYAYRLTEQGDQALADS
jgi:hypothetical protein